ncbi:hypothetical protein I7I50_10008 [Histoplasma capsulatum G186AR]|uniref:Uncharacterized protein n=1 Tax=Ajellomyces capsulatus TaxID=5037 RepID=A0A8H7Z5T0_AJECA|nr:hypothetical protein I7I52_01246 [Histoplasma capsulatum]QSS68889.1 hypothetical protein I7I50_10008 [Histoplasma capsulatum G186AR]
MGFYYWLFRAGFLADHVRFPEQIILTLFPLGSAILKSERGTTSWRRPALKCSTLQIKLHECFVLFQMLWLGLVCRYFSKIMIIDRDLRRSIIPIANWKYEGD